MSHLGDAFGNEDHLKINKIIIIKEDLNSDTAQFNNNYNICILL